MILWRAITKHWAVTLFLVSFLGSSFFAFSDRNSRVQQPIAFSHKKHMDLGMECVSCHIGAEEGIHAGIPKTETCARCHVPGQDYPPTPKELAQYIESGKEIPWLQFQVGKRHVYFSHRRHVKIAQLDCTECHGDIRNMDQPITRAYFPSGQKGMNRCIDCHRRNQVTTDCYACHR